MSADTNLPRRGGEELDERPDPTDDSQYQGQSDPDAGHTTEEMSSSIDEAEERHEAEEREDQEREDREEQEERERDRD